MKNTTRLFLFALLATLVPMLLFSGTLFYIGRQSLTRFIGERLTGVNQTKASAVNSFYSDLEPLKVPLPEAPGARDQLEIIANKQSSASSRTTASQHLDAILSKDYQQAELEEVVFAKTDKTVVYAFSAEETTKLGAALPEFLIPGFDVGQRGNQLSDLYKDPAGHFSLSVSQPVNDKDGYPIGVIIFHYDFQEVIDEVASSTGLSETGETFFGKKDVEQFVLFLSPLKTDPSAALTKRSKITDIDIEPLKRGLEGQSGFGMGTDYRAVSVISAWEPLAVPGWAIVTKIDQSEGLSTFRNIRGAIFLLLVGLSIVLSTGIYFAIRNTVRKPLQSLERSAEMIEKERYDRAAVDPSLLYSQDEFGAIATSLHHIVEHHRGHKHETDNEG